MTEQEIDVFEQTACAISLTAELLEMYEAEARKVLGEGRDLNVGLWRIIAKARAGQVLVLSAEVRRLRAENDQLSAERDEARMVADKKHNMIRALIGLKDELYAEIAALRARLALFEHDAAGFARLEGTMQATGDGWPLDHGAIYRPDDSPRKTELRDLP